MLEIERKFIVDTEKWSPSTSGEKLIQAYLSTDRDRVVRVRIKGEKAFLTIKGNMTGITRTELEYEIPVDEAKIMLKMCLDHPIEKTRYEEEIEGKIWEIDIFEGSNKGLVLAEIELTDEKEAVNIPNWAKKEVSTDKKYFNAWLSMHPFSTW